MICLKDWDNHSPEDEEELRIWYRNYYASHKNKEQERYRNYYTEKKSTKRILLDEDV
jgi:hypothetical protein